MGNLVQTSYIGKTYIDKYEPWSGILAAAVFAIISTANRSKFYSTRQLLFCRDVIILIKHTVDWELVLQKNQKQTNKYTIHKNNKSVNHN